MGKSCSCEDGFTWGTIAEKPKGGKKKQLQKIKKKVVDAVKKQIVKTKIGKEEYEKLYATGMGCLNANKTEVRRAKKCQCVTTALKNSTEVVGDRPRLACATKKFGGVKYCTCPDGFAWGAIFCMPEKKPKGRPHHKPIINEIPKKLREKASWLKQFKKSFNQMMAMKKKKKADKAGWSSKFKTNFKKNDG